MVSDIASESSLLIPNLTTEPPFSAMAFLSQFLSTTISCPLKGSCEFDSGVATKLWEFVYFIRIWKTQNKEVKLHGYGNPKQGL